MIPLKDDNFVKKFPFWVIIVIAVNIYVFYQELASGNPDLFISQYALIPSQVDLLSLSSLFPFISSQFIHAGFLHIISNMLFLWIFGDNIEASLGFLLFPLFYLGSGIVAGLTQYLLAPSDSIPMLGASGAVAGVLGSYFALFPYNKVKTLIFIFIFVTLVDLPAYVLLLFWFITQLFNGVASVTSSASAGGIAFLPHIGGFLFGWLITLVVMAEKRHFGLKLYG